ncbi:MULTISPECIES: hypothetical protein [unclassified Nocardioides]|uniref:hypothetical protein n=1 Tax=unclassified Nocardioides TaxID=2615069 RepID=UPI0006FF87DC|nr:MULTISPECIES: hypothetical protein [unclassified Nocardioides]KQY54343.1 hypothetical protein ASD30_19255 [Nocardioides sp. Root140]KRF10498.1 hypothetical protein ASH02_20580 [Nocardioides sp. Soil796]
MHWLGDFLRWLDPAWVTACIALVAGGYTVLNVHTVRRAYFESTDDRKIAQARLVWAEVGKHVGKQKGAIAGDMGAKWLGTKAKIVGDSAADFEGQEIDGQRVSVTTRELTIHRVEVINNSAEPIGHVRIELHGMKPLRPASDEATEPAEPRQWTGRPNWEIARAIKPGETRVFRVVAPVALRDVGRHKFVTVSFTDSAGQRWTRTDTKPPKPSAKPKRQRFPKAQAWKNRRLMQVRTIKRGIARR